MAHDFPLVSDELKKILDAHTVEIRQFMLEYNNPSGYRPDVYGYDWLPDHFLKYGYKRVVNAERIKALIKKDGLTDVDVIEKYLYHIPGEPEELSDDNYVTITRKFNGITGKGLELDMKHAINLWVLSFGAGHFGLDCNNYGLENGMLKILNTDEYHMPDSKTYRFLCVHYLFCGNGQHEGAKIDTSKIINDPKTNFENMIYSKYANFDSKTRSHLRAHLDKEEKFRRKILDEVCEELKLKQSQIMEMVMKMISYDRGCDRNCIDSHVHVLPSAIPVDVMEWVDSIFPTIVAAHQKNEHKLI